MARPNDGKVADNGTFIFNDWGFGDGLKEPSVPLILWARTSSSGASGPIS